MNITIPNSTKQSRPGTISDIVVVAEGDDPEEVVPFHKHCQKTVCSMYGHPDTESVIADRQFPSLDEFSPGWRDTFQYSYCMEDDLLAMLGLTDKIIYDYGKANFTLQFNASNGVMICDKLIKPNDLNLPHNYVLGDFGRTLTLGFSIGGDTPHTVKFNTMNRHDDEVDGDSPAEDDNLVMSIPTKTVQFKSGNTNLGSITGVFVQDEAIDIPPPPPQDLNDLASETISGESITIDGQHGAYVKKTSQNVDFPNFQYADKYSNSILRWEVHMANTGDANIQVSEPVQPEGWTYTKLTSSFTVAPNKTIVYVFKSNVAEKHLTYYSEPTSDPLDAMYPIGTVYTNASPDFNPNSEFGGTWDNITPEGSINQQWQRRT